jgi:hypothetical protein
MTGQSLGDAWHETCLGWEGAAAAQLSSAGGEGEQSEPVGGVVGAGLDARPNDSQRLAWSCWGALLKRRGRWAASISRDVDYRQDYSGNAI